MSLQQSSVHVDGYMRGNSQVRPYDRQPPGGITFDNKLKAEGQGIAAALGAILIDLGIQKFDEWLKKRERDKQEQTSK